MARTRYEGHSEQYRSLIIGEAGSTKQILIELVSNKSNATKLMVSN